VHAGVVLYELYEALEQTSLCAAELLHSEIVCGAARREEQIRCVTNQISHAKRVSEPAECIRKRLPFTPDPEDASHNGVQRIKREIAKLQKLEQLSRSMAMHPQGRWRREPQRFERNEMKVLPAASKRERQIRDFFEYCDEEDRRQPIVGELPTGAITPLASQ
jgi:hypothetical protein